MDSLRKKKLLKLQNLLNIKFKNKELLNQSLIHSSYSHEILNSEYHYEKLEFLGDSVISIVVEEYLVKNFYYYQVGDLVKIKSYIVSEDFLYKIAKKLHLNEYILLGKGEELSGGRNRKSLLADIFESVCGAYFIDRGFKKSKKFIIQFFIDIINKNKSKVVLTDYKTELQEYSQKNFKKNPVYSVVSINGYEHNKKFKVKVTINNKVYGNAEGKKKREAEKLAAQNALDNLAKNNEA